MFDFADCNGILFEWNNELNAVDGKALLEEDVVLYPLITAEFLGAALTRDVLIIEEEIQPHGLVKDLPTQKSFIALVAFAGVNAPRVIPANKDKYKYGNNNDDGILHVQDIPAQNPAQNMNPVIPLESEDEQDVALNDNNNVDSNDDDSTNNSNDTNDNNNSNNDYHNKDRNMEKGMLQAEQEATIFYKQTEQDQGVCRYPRHANRGVTRK
jgi:hypothetical protein